MKNIDSSISDKFLRKLMNSSPDMSHGDCRVTIEAGKGLLIEGCKGICEYNDDRIAVSTCNKIVVIEGCCMCIYRMIENTIVICGCVKSVSFT
ncbi:MAG: YabP/YqfC family sporulation protein [Clostridia bacterium]|nr:YabP/YqfC family sporulation protein [Clostridia bacterium]